MNDSNRILFFDRMDIQKEHTCPLFCGTGRVMDHVQKAGQIQKTGRMG